MNFEDEDEDPLTYKHPELTAKIEEVLSKLPSIHIDESDTSDEPVRRLTEAEMRASCTSLFSNSNSTASSSRDNKSEKKDEKNILDEPFFQVPDNVDELLDAELGTNFSKKKAKKDENANIEIGGHPDPINLHAEGPMNDSQLSDEEYSAAQGDGHQYETNIESITLAHISKIMSASCGEHLNPISGEGIMLEEGDCGARKLATSSGSRPEMSENAWKRASASTSNCGRPATVPKARARRSETASVMTNTEQSRDLMSGQKPKSKKNDEDESDDSDDGSWWEDRGKSTTGGGCPIPKRRTLLENKGPNVDITRQRSILDLCSVQHGETVDNIAIKDSSIEQKSEIEVFDSVEMVAIEGVKHENIYVENMKEDGGASGGGDGMTGGIHEEENRAIENSEIETVRSETWDWVNAIPRACFLDEVEQGESYLPLLSSIRDDDIDPRLLQHELQVSRHEWN